MSQYIIRIISTQIHNGCTCFRYPKVPRDGCCDSCVRTAKEMPMTARKDSRYKLQPGPLQKIHTKDACVLLCFVCDVLWFWIVPRKTTTKIMRDVHFFVSTFPELPSSSSYRQSRIPIWLSGDAWQRLITPTPSVLLNHTLAPHWNAALISHLEAEFKDQWHDMK